MARLPIGTRSLLWGAHQVALHPLFVALAWRRLYGRWPSRWPEWVAIVVHDLGYWGLGDMDGEEGERHPAFGTAYMAYHFDRGLVMDLDWPLGHWAWFAGGHSRSYAARLGMPTSPLMAADKLATVLMPLWLYAGLCWLSGEWLEYRARWVAAGTYPGRPDDGVLTWARHLQANWRRFERADAVAGKAYGGE
jgi:hypothetical protein